ncbi:MAG: deoxyribonuclease IV [Armatimonadota bacterium]|nr:deoxyribonuclease IV [Armatimonadota bacterium]
MRLGVHVRISKGLLQALDFARQLKCETIQLFSSNPNSWLRRPLNSELAAEFERGARALGISPIILHTPYLVNLASPDQEIWNKSKYALSDALTRARLLGADRVVTHIGSHKGAGLKTGIARVATAVNEALETADGAAVVLELGAGSGNAVGSSFEEIADILAAVKYQDRIGIAVDTAHLYAAGYDISTQQGVESVFSEIERLVGIDQLKVVHLNDTEMPLGSHRDKHHHIALGRIGYEGFRALLHHPATAGLPGIIETPAEGIEWDIRNLTILRQLLS